SLHFSVLTFQCCTDVIESDLIAPLKSCHPFVSGDIKKYSPADHWFNGVDTVLDIFSAEAGVFSVGTAMEFSILAHVSHRVDMSTDVCARSDHIVSSATTI